ncbi:MAG: hypothetical protein J6Y70_00505 [Bacilli bacterium]|nr:hypothetical protein [Bacilli bacterium]
MIYVYYSLTQKYFFDKKIEKISNKFLGEINNYNFFQLNTEECSEDDIINLCLGGSLFSEKKRVVIVKNAIFFESDKSAKKYKKLLNFLNKIDQTDQDNVLIFFFVYKDNIDENNIFYKTCQKNNVILENFSFKEYEWEAKIVKPFIKYKKIDICDEGIKILSERTKKDFALLINEVDKLQLYNEYISLELANKIVSVPVEENFFVFFANFIKRERNKVVTSLKELLKNKFILPNVLLNMLINNIRFMYLCRFLFLSKNNFKEIAKKLNSNEIRVKMSIQNLKNIKDEDMLFLLDNFYLVDRNVKNGYISYDLALELLTINFLNK